MLLPQSWHHSFGFGDGLMVWLMVCKLPFRICKGCGYSTTCTRVHRSDKMSKHKCYLLKSHQVPRCPGKRHPVLTQATTGPLGILQDLLCRLKQEPHHFSDIKKNLPVATRTRRYISIRHKHVVKRFKTVHRFMSDSHSILAAAAWVCAAVESLLLHDFKTDYYLRIMWNNVEEFGARSRVGRYLARVWALHVWFSTVVDSTLEHLLDASHEEDIGVGACDREHSLRRNQTQN